MQTEDKKPSEYTRTKLDMATAVGAFVDIYEVRLTHTQIALRSSSNKPSTVQTGHSTNYHRDNVAGKIVVEAKFLLDLIEEGQAESWAFIHATFGLAYNVRDLSNLSDQEIHAFGETTGLINAWPFWRELVYSSMARMGLPPITMPTFRLADETAAEKTEPPTTT